MAAIVLMLTVASAGAGVARAAPSVYLEDSPAAQDLVDRALALREQGRLADAAEHLHRVIAEYPNKLMQVEGQVYEDAAQWVRRRLREDEALLATYRQLYTGDAERLRREAMSGRIDAEALERIVERYAITEPGLDAGLTLAAIYLERAEASSAASVLDELAAHPGLANDENKDENEDADNAAQRKRYHYLQSTAGVLTGDGARQREHIEQIRQLGDQPRAASVTSLAERFEPPPSAGIRPHRETTTTTVSLKPGRAPLWETEIEWAPTQAQVINQRIRRQNDNAAVPMQPVVDGERLYLNQGDRVRALDRDSGTPIWTYQWSGVDPDEFGRRLPEPLPQQRGVLVHGDRVFAIMGQASPHRARMQRDQSTTALTAVNHADGTPLWEVRPEALHDELSQTDFLGTPMAAGGRVFVLMRRSQASGFKDTFIIALSQSDGELLWHRHLASAAMTSQYSVGPPPRMTFHGGMVYVTDNLGAVAAVDHRTGAMRWVRLLAEGEQFNGEQRRGFGTVQVQGAAVRPVLCPAGLLVREPVEGNVLLLDPRTGQRRKTLSGEPWAGVEALIPVGGDVLIVGSTLTLVDGRALESQWRYALPAGAPESPEGQIAVTSTHVYCATSSRLIVLGLDEGEVQDERDVDTPANILPLDGQVVVVTSQHVRSYASWERTAERLRQRIDDSPIDPRPGLALAHLALRTGQSDVAVQGVDAALEALRELQRQIESDLTDADFDAHQKMTFDRLLEMARDDRAAETDLRLELFDRLATITDGPKQTMTYHLAVAAALSDEGEPARAVQHLQAVLQEEALASQLYEASPVSRNAGLEARGRLQEVVDKHGRSVYDQFEQRAARRLRELTDRRAETSAFIALAERYPLASASPRALMHAAEQLAAQGDLPRANQQVRRAWAWASTPDLVGEIASRVATLYEKANRPRRAIARLKQLRDEHPHVEPTRDGKTVPVDQWLAELEKMEPGAGSLPQLSLPLDTPRVLRGRLLTIDSADDAAHVNDVLLTLDGSTLRRYSHDDLSQRWQIESPVPQPTLVAVNSDHLLLWSDSARRIVAINDANGRVQWRSAEVTEQLKQIDALSERKEVELPQDARARQMAQLQRAQLNRNAQHEEADDAAQRLFTATGPSTIAVADGVGRVIGIDRDNGEVLWRLIAPTERVRQIAVAEDTLVLAGVTGVDSNARSGSITVLDMLKGEQRLHVVEDNQSLDWVGLAGEGLLAVVAGQRVTTYRLATGEVAWRTEIESGSSELTGHGWADQQMLMLAEANGVMRLIDAETGQMLGRLQLDERSEAPMVRAEPVERRWYVMTGDGVVAVDDAGRTRWKDGITAENQVRVGHLATRDHLVLLAREERAMGGAVLREDGEFQQELTQRQAGQAGLNYRLYVLDRISGLLAAEHPLGPVQSPLRARAARVIENQLVVPMTDRTVVIPGADAGDAARAPDAPTKPSTGPAS